MFSGSESNRKLRPGRSRAKKEFHLREKDGLQLSLSSKKVRLELIDRDGRLSGLIVSSLLQLDSRFAGSEF